MAAPAGDPAEKLLARLEAVKTTGPGRWIARCPAHADRRPSLSIRQVDAGLVLLRCWAGCAAAEIMAAVGLTLSDLFPRPEEHHRGPIPKRSRWDRADAWRCVQHEAIVASIAAADAAAGRPVSAEDAERAGLAADRLSDACSALGVSA